MTYKFKRVDEEGYVILEDGHPMFPEDVRKRLNQLVYLEEKADAAKSMLNEIKKWAEYNTGMHIDHERKKELIEIVKKYFL